MVPLICNQWNRLQKRHQLKNIHLNSQTSSKLKILNHAINNVKTKFQVVNNDAELSSNYIYYRGAPAAGRGEDPPPPQTAKIVVEEWCPFPELYKMTKVLEDWIENRSRINFPLEIFVYKFKNFSKHFKS